MTAIVFWQTNEMASIDPVAAPLAGPRVRTRGLVFYGTSEMELDIRIDLGLEYHAPFDLMGSPSVADHPAFTSTHEELEGLEPSTRYLFHIVAHDESGGCVTSNVITKTTKAKRGGQETP